MFSSLYNESEGFLDAYCDNFLSHTGENEMLVVNLAQQCGAAAQILPLPAQRALGQFPAHRRGVRPL
ncbi:MAG: hypothetical protein MO853_09475 [Candidatus Protistobacter heckmanni]|nr:hypothetical protein [Candidatus Protistobacter heckmanni]